MHCCMEIQGSLSSHALQEILVSVGIFTDDEYVGTVYINTIVIYINDCSIICWKLSIQWQILHAYSGFGSIYIWSIRLCIWPLLKKNNRSWRTRLSREYHYMHVHNSNPEHNYKNAAYITLHFTFFSLKFIYIYYIITTFTSIAFV